MTSRHAARAVRADCGSKLSLAHARCAETRVVTQVPNNTLGIRAVHEALQTRSRLKLRHGARRWCFDCSGSGCMGFRGISSSAESGGAPWRRVRGGLLPARDTTRGDVDELEQRASPVFALACDLSDEPKRSGGTVSPHALGPQSVDERERRAAHRAHWSLKFVRSWGRAVRVCPGAVTSCWSFRITARVEQAAGIRRAHAPGACPAQPWNCPTGLRAHVCVVASPVTSAGSTAADPRAWGGPPREASRPHKSPRTTTARGGGSPTVGAPASRPHKMGAPARVAAALVRRAGTAAASCKRAGVPC